MFIVMLIVADLALRLGAGLGNPVLYQADAACGYLPVPGQDVRRFSSTNFINAFSQRSAEVPAQKPPGHYRVLFIGDSVTYGTTFVDQSKIFTAVVARDLPDHMKQPVDVLNAAVGAWAVGNEVGYLQSRGTFGADVVIFVLNTGDLVQPFNPGILKADAGYPTREPLCALSELWLRYLWPRIVRRARAHDAGSTAGVEEPPNRIEEILSKLNQARAICAKSSARMAIVFSPCAGPYWDQPPYPEALLRLRQWTNEQSVPLVDLSSYYGQASAAEVYWDGTHLRPRGNALAADGIEANWSKIIGRSTLPGHGGQISGERPAAATRGLFDKEKRAAGLIAEPR